MQIEKKVGAAMVGVGACARLLPHPWNFTPIIAIALYTGTKSTKLRWAILTTLLALLLSDAIMGFYRGMWYVYAATLIPVLIGRLLRDNERLGTIVAATAASSISFFLITNFMVWATGHMYPHNTSGLATCFFAGLPFYGNQLLDTFYTLALFGGHALLLRFAQSEPQAA